MQVEITEVNENEEQTSRTEIIPYRKKNWFSIETGNKQSTYNFTTRLITCGGKIGEESETHKCVRGINFACCGGDNVSPRAFTLENGFVRFLFTLNVEHADDELINSKTLQTKRCGEEKF